MSDFYGRLRMNVTSESEYFRGNATKSAGKVEWVVKDDTKINQNTQHIEDGDYLEAYDDMGRTVFAKQIIEDDDSYYSVALKKQIYNGTTVEWLPFGVDAGYWCRLFNNGYRAKLVKFAEDE